MITIAALDLDCVQLQFVQCASSMTSGQITPEVKSVKLVSFSLFGHSGNKKIFAINECGRSFALKGLKKLKVENNCKHAQLILVTTTTTDSGVLFSSRCTFFFRERERNCF